MDLIWRNFNYKGYLGKICEDGEGAAIKDNAAIVYF